MSRSNRCRCPNPPGGEVICEPDEIAVCVRSSNEIITRCVRPVADRDAIVTALRMGSVDQDPSLADFLFVSYFLALREFLETEVPEDVQVDLPDARQNTFLSDLREFLLSGIILNAGGEEVGRFRLPRAPGTESDLDHGVRTIDPIAPTPAYSVRTAYRDVES